MLQLHDLEGQMRGQIQFFVKVKSCNVLSGAFCKVQE